MIPTIGIIVCIYAITRLLLLPAEMSGESAGAGTWTLVWIAAVLIGICGCALVITSGAA